MTVSLADRRAISRQLSAGIGHLDVALEFGIRVRDVQRIELAERRKLIKPRVAEPLPSLRSIDWKTARPPEARVRRGETCRTPKCSGTVERGSYCGHCAALVYAGRAA